MSLSPITYESIQAAHLNIKHLVTKTPLLTSPQMNEILGYRLFIKAENLQKTGAFKFRGAANAILNNPDSKHIVAYSSGNHAQAVAHMAQLLQKKATIIMPSDAPTSKITSTKNYGADVVFYDRYSESREDIGDRIISNAGGDGGGVLLVKPYDNYDVINGQGTTGIEILDQISELNLDVSHVLCCAGGGGLISGLAVALHHHYPDISIHSVEPVGYDDIKCSLIKGERVCNDMKTRTICDAITTPTPGQLTFPIMHARVTSGYSVSDDEVLHAMNSVYQYFKLVLEPGGAVAVAAGIKLKKLLTEESSSGSGDGGNSGGGGGGTSSNSGGGGGSGGIRDVIVIASGGNVDTQIFLQALNLQQPPQPPQPQV